MNCDIEQLERRIGILENKLRRRSQISVIAVVAALATVATSLYATSTDKRTDGQIIDEVRTRKLVVVDDQDRIRVTIDQDAPEIDRYERSAGLTIFDDQGSERGGIATIDDGSAVIALDAPWGVGSPMRDRAGTKVFADGSSAMGLISNRGAFAAVLRSDGDSGFLDLSQPDDAKGIFEQRTLSVNGESKSTEPMSDSQRKVE